MSALYGTGTGSAMKGIRFGMSNDSVSSVWTANRSGGTQVTPSGAAPVYNVAKTWTQSVTWGQDAPISNPVVLNANGTFQVNGGLNETGVYYTFMSEAEQYIIMVFSNNNATLGGKVTCPGSLRIAGISMQTMTYPEDPRRVGTFTMQ